jgi:hypothetical protein
VSPGVPAGPLEPDPGGFVPEEERSAILAGVLDCAGLGGLDTSTALTIASWIARAREAGPGR